ncbi:MAG TPA: uroporphyrinogen decarboxylase [Gaiellaceae bacterium]|nr:uroporphyrinogen decarboxylase [Gaiellaceae bacterium]
MDPLLVRAARREPVEHTPVWFMRQAGRSLPEYRTIRERHSFWEVAGTPDLCAEVTLQPVRRHGVDAAVMFADIMTPVLGMGLHVDLVEGVGPVVEQPVRTLADVEALRVPDPEDAFAPLLEAIRIVRGELAAEQAVIGFCGGPFTVAGYLVEGRPSREFATVKTLMYSEPAVWRALMEKLAGCFGSYVAAQARAGADVVQLFDSWVGALSPADYEEFVAPWSARILAAAGVPTIHFGTGASTLLPAMARAGGDVIGLDWRIALDDGWAIVGPEHAVQGNLDPAVLLGPWERVEAAALDVLTRAGGRPGHIFNLGHGVLPRTDPDVVSRLAELVQRSTVHAGA